MRTESRYRALPDAQPLPTARFPRPPSGSSSITLGGLLRFLDIALMD